MGTPSGCGPVPSTDLDASKLALEVDKLRLEVRSLECELDRAGRPTKWEVVKTTVPWLSVAVGALALATSFVGSLQAAQREQLAVATEHFLGERPEIGTALLANLASPPEGWVSWLQRRFGLRTPNVTSILVGGIDFSASELTRSTHWRNLAALEQLAANAPGLCAKQREGSALLRRQLAQYPPEEKEDVEAAQDRTNWTVSFLCRVESLLTEEACAGRDDWKGELGDNHKAFLLVPANCRLAA